MLGDGLDVSSRFRPESLENPGPNGADLATVGGLPIEKSLSVAHCRPIL
jgi:hypothetical protein